MKKRVLAALLSGCMVLGTFAGSATALAEDGDMVTINVYRISYNVSNPDENQVQKVEDAINEYIADKINVQIKLNDIGASEYNDKTNLAIANGEANMVWTASWNDTIGTDDLWRQNAAYDLTDLLDGTTLYDSMPEDIWTASKYDGKVLFVPVYKESYEGYDLKIRQDLMDEFGWDFSDVTELKDLEPMLEDAKSLGLKYPYCIMTTPMFYRYYIDSYDFFSNYSFLAIDRETEEVVNPIHNQDYIDFCTLMCEWAEKGYISEDEVTKVTSPNETQNETWAINWWTCVPEDEANTEERDGMDEYIVEGFTGKWSHSTTTLGSCYAVTANSTEEEAKACVDFLGLLYTDTRLADLYTYGIEGEDYTLNEDGRVVQTSDAYNHSAWESTSIVPLTLLDTESADKVEQYEENNAAAQSSVASGFRFDKSNVDAQFTACANIFDEYGYVLEVGGYASADVESVIDEYQAALDEAGYQDVFDEATAQWEAWRAEQ